MSVEVLESRFPVGSSASRIAGLFINDRAMATRCCCPPESWFELTALAALEAQQLQRGARTRITLGHVAGIKERQLDVLNRAGPREQVEALEDESDAPAPNRRQLRLSQRGDIDAFEQVDAAGRAIEASNDVHQSRFAGTGGAHNRHELAALDSNADAAQRAHLDIAEVVSLREIANFYDDIRHNVLRVTAYR